MFLRGRTSMAYCNPYAMKTVLSTSQGLLSTQELCSNRISIHICLVWMFLQPSCPHGSGFQHFPCIVKVRTQITTMYLSVEGRTTSSDHRKQLLITYILLSVGNTTPIMCIISNWPSDLARLLSHRSGGDSFISQTRGQWRDSFREILRRDVLRFGALWGSVKICHRLRILRPHCHCWCGIQGAEIWSPWTGTRRQSGPIGLDKRRPGGSQCVRLFEIMLVWREFWRHSCVIQQPNPWIEPWERVNLQTQDVSRTSLLHIIHSNP